MHIAQGSPVVYIVLPRSAEDPCSVRPRRIAIISPCAVGSPFVLPRLWARTRICPQRTITAPNGKSPCRASSSAARMNRSSSADASVAATKRSVGSTAAQASAISEARRLGRFLVRCEQTWRKVIRGSPFRLSGGAPILLGCADGAVGPSLGAAGVPKANPSSFIVRRFPRHSESGCEINPVDRVGFVAKGQQETPAPQQTAPRRRGRSVWHHFENLTLVWQLRARQPAEP
jgi:hypothetical protein